MRKVSFNPPLACCSSDDESQPVGRQSKPVRENISAPETIDRAIELHCEEVALMFCTALRSDSLFGSYTVALSLNQLRARSPQNAMKTPVVVVVRTKIRTAASAMAVHPSARKARARRKAAVGRKRSYMRCITRSVRTRVVAKRYPYAQHPFPAPTGTTGKRADGQQGENAYAMLQTYLRRRGILLWS